MCYEAILDLTTCLQCVVRPSLNEASALGFRLCKVCGARLLLDR